MISVFTATCACLYAFFYILLRMLFPKSLQSLAYFLTIIGILIYIQTNLFLWDYGTLNGTYINFNNFIFNGILELALYLVLIVLFVKKHKLFEQSIIKICYGLLSVQFIGVLFIISTTSASAWNHLYQVTTDNYFDFGKEKNVIIVTLDAVRSDVFAELLSEDKLISKKFEGFTFFRNTSGIYSGTNPSVAGILTEKYYTHTKPTQEEFSKFFTSETSLPYRLKKEGFRVEIYPYNNSSVYLDQTITDNLAPINKYNTITNLITLKTALKILTFNLVPHFGKQYLYKNDSIYSNFLSDSVAKNRYLPSKKDNDIPDNILEHVRYNIWINSQFKQNISNKSTATFKYFHYHGGHPPFIHDKNYKPILLPYNSESYKEQIHGSLLTVYSLFEGLKNLGLYERSLIFVISDHGYYVSDSDKVPTASISSAEIQALTPLLLVKPINNTKNNLIISNAPTSLSDISATVFSELNIPFFGSGKSVYTIKEISHRPRVSRFSISKSTPTAAIEYTILGNVQNIEDWTFSGNCCNTTLGCKECSYQKASTQLLEYRNLMFSSRREQFINH